MKIKSRPSVLRGAGFRAAGSSDEGDADGDVGRLGSLRRLLSDEVFHHGVLGHVLHQVGLLKHSSTEISADHVGEKSQADHYDV